MSSSTAAASGAPLTPFFYVPGPLRPVRVNLDDWPGWHLSRSPWLEAPPSLAPRLGPPQRIRTRARRPVRPARRLRTAPPRVHLPRGTAVVWMGTPWVVHTVPPPRPAPGTPVGDLHLIASPSSSLEDRLAALERTVSRVAWVPRRPTIRRTLKARAGDGVGGAGAAGGASIEDVRKQELRAAVYLVLAESARPQRHRFGRSWATGPDGRPSALLPDRLPPPLYWRWFCDEVRKAAEAALSGDPYPSYPSDAPRPRVDAVAVDLDSLPGDGAAGDPLERLLRAERGREAAAYWRTAVGQATPRQRELLRALAWLHHVRHDGAPTLADAAALTGMAPSTARVQWKRLVERLRQSGAQPPAGA